MNNQIILSLIIGALCGFVVGYLDIPKEIKAFLAICLIGAAVFFLLGIFGINIFI